MQTTVGNLPVKSPQWQPDLNQMACTSSGAVQWRLAGNAVAIQIAPHHLVCLGHLQRGNGIVNAGDDVVTGRRLGAMRQLSQYRLTDLPTYRLNGFPHVNMRAQDRLTSSTAQRQTQGFAQSNVKMRSKVSCAR